MDKVEPNGARLLGADEPLCNMGNWQCLRTISRCFGRIMLGALWYWLQSIVLVNGPSWMSDGGMCHVYASNKCMFVFLLYRYVTAGVQLFTMMAFCFGFLHSCRWCRNEWECYSIELEFNDSAILWLSWTEIWGNWQLCGQEHQIAHRWWYYPFAVKSTQQGTHL